MPNILIRKSIAQLKAEAEETEVQALVAHGGVPLKRTLSMWSLVSLGIGCIIGAGIFVLTGHAAATNAGDRQQARLLQPLSDTLDFTSSGDKPGGRNRQVVRMRGASDGRGPGFVAAPRQRGRPEPDLLVGLELERQLQALGGIAVWMGRLALQLLNAVHAEPGALGQP